MYSNCSKYRDMIVSSCFLAHILFHEERSLSYVSIISKSSQMNKKTAYYGYYYSVVQDITPAQLKSSTELPSVDVSLMEKRMEEQHIHTILSSDIEYPRRLQTIPHVPYLVYFQGSLEVLQKPTLAIVGPRQMSPYAQEILIELFRHLRYYDIVTVSGMAPGVDTLCHDLSLQYDIPTVAVLG